MRIPEFCHKQSEILFLCIPICLTPDLKKILQACQSKNSFHTPILGSLTSSNSRKHDLACDCYINLKIFISIEDNNLKMSCASNCK